MADDDVTLRSQRGRQRVCVIGAGVGSIIAIALGKLGIDVTMVDERSTVLGGASGAQLARLHLGHHYSGDDRFAPGLLNTAQRCTLGTLAWLRRYPEAAPTPGRWWQLITTDSMTAPEDYLMFCQTLGDFQDGLARGDPFARQILTGSIPSLRRLAAAEYVDHVAPGRVVLGVETAERVIDLDCLRRAIARDLQRLPNIDVRLSTRVTAIRPGVGGGCTVELAGGEQLEVDVAVNASWHDLTALMPEIGPPAAMTTRLRLVASADAPGSLKRIPSMFFHRGVLGSHTTFAQGSVRFVSEPVCNFASLPGVGVPGAWRGLMLRPQDPACWVDGIGAALRLRGTHRGDAAIAPQLDLLTDQLAGIVGSSGADAGERVHDHIAAAIVDGYAGLVPAIRRCRNVRVSPTVSVDVGRTDVWRPSGSVHRRDWVVDAHAPGVIVVNPGKFTFGILAADDAVARVVAHLDAGQAHDLAGPEVAIERPDVDVAEALARR